MSCTVILLASTPNPDELVAAAARICYRDVTAADLLRREEESLSEDLLSHIWRSGHHSPFEHAVFTFAVDGLSRVASHQLVRHRMASFSQQSQRYVRMAAPDVVTPPSVAAHPEAAAIFDRQARAAHEAYPGHPRRGRPLCPSPRLGDPAGPDDERAGAAPLLPPPALPQGPVGDTGDGPPHAGRMPHRRAGHLPQGRPVVPLRSLHRGAALRKTLQRYGGPPCDRERLIGYGASSFPPSSRRRRRGACPSEGRPSSRAC